MLTDFLLWLLVTYNYLLRVLSLYKNSKIQFLHSYLRLPHQNVIKLKHNAMNHIRQTWFKFWQYVIKAKFYRVIVTYRRCLELGLLGKFGRIEVLPWSWWVEIGWNSNVFSFLTWKKDILSGVVHVFEQIFLLFVYTCKMRKIGFYERVS